MISTIFLDWGGVLIEPGLREAKRYWARTLGVEVGDLSKALELFVPRFQLGLISEPGFWARVYESLEVPAASEPLWEAALSLSYVEHDVVLDACRELRDQGYRVGLISNTEKPAARFFVHKMAVDGRYAAIEKPVFSCDVGCAKPDAAIFLEAVQRFGSDPSHCVFLDDSQENIRTARELGMLTIHVSDPARAVGELKALLRRNPRGATPGV